MSPDPSQARALRVLAADDHPANRAVIEAILSLVGADLVCVEDGAQAVEAFQTGDFDVVLMDLQMPVMDGLAAIREMRRYETETERPRTPVLAVSANAMAEHLAASREAGADRHMAKPVMPQILLQTVSDMVAGAAEVAEQPAVALRARG